MARPELRSYTQRLNWVKAQLAHQRAVVQATALARSPGDVQVGEFAGGAPDTEEPALACLQALEQLVRKDKGKGAAGAAPFRPPSGAKGGGKGGGAKGGQGVPDTGGGKGAAGAGGG